MPPCRVNSSVKTSLLNAAYECGNNPGRTIRFVKILPVHRAIGICVCGQPAEFGLCFIEHRFAIGYRVFTTHPYGTSLTRYTMCRTLTNMTLSACAHCDMFVIPSRERERVKCRIASHRTRHPHRYTVPIVTCPTRYACDIDKVSRF